MSSRYDFILSICNYSHTRKHQTWSFNGLSSVSGQWPASFGSDSSPRKRRTTKACRWDSMVCSVWLERDTLVRTSVKSSARVILERVRSVKERYGMHISLTRHEARLVASLPQVQVITASAMNKRVNSHQKYIRKSSSLSDNCYMCESCRTAWRRCRSRGPISFLLLLLNFEMSNKHINIQNYDSFNASVDIAFKCTSAGYAAYAYPPPTDVFSSHSTISYIE